VWPEGVAQRKCSSCAVKNVTLGTSLNLDELVGVGLSASGAIDGPLSARPP
jgi:hypothetical protein